MTTTTKKRVLILTSTNGHRSIAKAVQEHLSIHFSVTTEEYVLNEVQNIYKLFYHLLPSFFYVLFRLAENKKMFQIFSALAITKHKEPIFHLLKRQKPDIVINTFGFFVPLCDLFSIETGIPYINIVPDPFTFNRNILSKHAKTNLLYNASNTLLDNTREEQCCNIFSIGWFTRKEFFRKISLEVVRKKLQLPLEGRYVLLSGGSDGSLISLLALFSIISTRLPYQILVACGSNTTLLRVIKVISLFYKQTLIGIPYTNSMHEYIHASDLVIGKAGPNLLFECIASEKPLVAFTHISGQEDGNIQYMKNANIGYIKENFFSLRRFLIQAFNHPQLLLSCKENILHEKKYIIDKSSKLPNIVKKFL